MPPLVALVVGAALVFYAFRSDRKRDLGDTGGLFWPTLWYLVVASRPIGVWLNIWGVPISFGGDAVDGSPIDRLFYGALTIIGLLILARRRFDWGLAFRQNGWLTALLVFMGLSIVWSQYPYISFKRYIKILGSVVMALVVLTHENPLDSIRTVLRRGLYVHLPMSIICTRYFRQIGVSFDWSGTAESWQGIATSKNTLGQIAMLGVVYFLWEVRRQWPTLRWRNLHCLYLLMALYLVKGSDEAVSMTSLSVSLVATIAFLRIQALRSRIAAIYSFVKTIYFGTAALITLVMAHSLFLFKEDSVFGFFITKFGRDITLTDRTYIWSDVYAATGNPLLGVGYGGFWIGRVMNIPWNANMTWVLGQAHSGYVDTYLQTGLIGLALLFLMLFTAVPRLLRSLHDDFNLACFRLTLLLTILFVNITESVYLRGDHHLWFVLLLVLLVVPTAGFRQSPDHRPQSG